MHNKNRYIIKEHSHSFRSSLKRAILAFGLLISGLSLTGYLYLLPQGLTSHSLSSALPGPLYASVPSEPQTFPTLEKELSCPAHGPGCREIVEITGQGDTLRSLMHANVAEDKVADRVARELAQAIRAATGRPFSENTSIDEGRSYNVAVDEKGRFLKASVELNPSNVFFAVAEGDGSIKTWKEDVVLDYRVEALTVKTRGSLTESLLNMGEGPELAAKLLNVFRWDIDFQSETYHGDTCKILFERRYADDKPSGYGAILFARYEGKKTGKKTAVLFKDEYFDESGLELKRNFLRSPLSTTRVTSRFGNRFHPILRVWRHHNGVDYGAPQGTPVWAVSGGIVTFSGWNKGYGNYVCIKHDNGYESRYGHLKAKFVNVGQRVKQKQRIGLVGMTGIASGPHLDFQLLVKGKHINPLSVKMVNTLKTIPGALKPRFSEVFSDKVSELTRLVVTRNEFSPETKTLTP